MEDLETRWHVSMSGLQILEVFQCTYPIHDCLIIVLLAKIQKTSYITCHYSSTFT